MLTQFTTQETRGVIQIKTGVKENPDSLNNS